MGVKKNVFTKGVAWNRLPWEAVDLPSLRYLSHMDVMLKDIVVV